MSTDLVVRQAELVRLDTEQIKFLAHTEFVPERIRGNLPMIFATIATGREIGIGDMASLRHIHMIDGKPGYSAEIMVAVVHRNGHSIVGETNDGKATATGTRGDNGDTITVTWTRDMADRAGLLSKGNWKKYEPAMLWARAVSQLCRMLFPDCTAGFTYTEEELEDSSSEPRAAAAAPSAPVSGESGLSASLDEEAAGDAGGDDPAPPAADNAEGTPFAYDIDAPVEPAGSHKPVYIGEKQRTRLFTIATKAGVPEEDVRAIVVEFTGQESTKLIKKGCEYDGIIAAIQAKAAA